MKLNITVHGENGYGHKLESVDGYMIDYEYANDFKIFVYKDSNGGWKSSEFYTGMQLLGGKYGTGYKNKQNCIDETIQIVCYGNNIYTNAMPVEERISWLNEELVKGNLDRYGYANRD